MRELIDQLSSSSTSNDVSLEDIYREASNLHVERYIAEELITRLKHKGDLMSIDHEHVRAVW